MSLYCFNKLVRSVNQTHWHFISSYDSACFVNVHHTPDSKVHGANIGPTWVLTAPDRLNDAPNAYWYQGIISWLLAIVIFTSIFLLLSCWRNCVNVAVKRRLPAYHAEVQGQDSHLSFHRQRTRALNDMYCACAVCTIHATILCIKSYILWRCSWIV